MLESESNGQRLDLGTKSVHGTREHTCTHLTVKVSVIKTFSKQTKTASLCLDFFCLFSVSLKLVHIKVKRGVGGRVKPLNQNGTGDQFVTGVSPSSPSLCLSLATKQQSNKQTTTVNAIVSVQCFNYFDRTDGRRNC